MKLYSGGKQGLLLSVLLSAFLFYAMGVCHAADIQHKIIKLSDLMLVNEQINLRNIEATYSINYAVSNRIKLHKVRLHLDFTNSNALLRERSQLVVLVNGVVVEQFVLDAQKSRNISDVIIPTEYFVAGYNAITFAVAQHYTLQCEIPESAELWTQINSTQSYLAVDSSYVSHRYTLADLNDVMDKKLPDYAVSLLRPNSRYQDQDLQWGSLLAQAVALRLDYKSFDMTILQAKATTAKQRSKLAKKDPLRFLQQSNLTTDAVLIGTVDELKDVLSPELKAKVTGAYLGIYPGLKKHNQLIIISGTTEAEVTQAAIAFTYTWNAFPDSHDMLVHDLQMPLYPLVGKPGVILSGQIYTFKMLGLFTRTMTHKSNQSELVVNMPSDLYHELKSEVTLKLDFNYGAAFRPDSVLNIRINGVFAKAVMLDNKYGDSYQDYTIKIPSSSFVPGLNKINFEAVIPPMVSGDCTVIQDKNRVLTLLDSSTIQFPELDHYTRLPDLALLKRTGFPYLNSLVGAELGMVLRDHKFATILAAWKLMAKLSQINDAPLPDAQLSFNTINNKHLFIIGARASLHAEDLTNAPVQFNERILFPYSAGYMADVEQKSLFERLENFLFSEGTSLATVSLEPLHAKLQFNASLGAQALMMSYPATDSGRLNTLITYDDAEVFSNSMEQLVQPEVWGRLEHNIAIWENDKTSLETLRSGDEFYIGHTSVRHKLAYYFSAHGFYWLVFIMLLLLAIAFMAHQLLKRYKLKHHHDIQEYDS